MQHPNTAMFAAMPGKLGVDGQQPYAQPHPLLVLPELTIRLSGLYPATTTYDIWRNFSGSGTIVFIELFENRFGVRDGHAKIRFSPPPEVPFWTKGTYRFTTEDGISSYNVRVSCDENTNRVYKIQNPLKKSVFYDEKMKLSPSALDFGVMLYPNSTMPLQTVQARGPKDMSFVVDLRRNRIVATFNVTFRDPRSAGVTDFTSKPAIGQYDRINKYMFQIPFGQLKTINQVVINDTTFALVISLESPPEFLRKREDDKATHSRESLVWNEYDSWFRQTDIVYDPYRLQTAPVSLHKETPVIDIGICKN
jgi:RNA-dependent RNA polymerase